MAYQYLFDPNKQFQNVAGVNNVAGFLRVFYNGTDDRAVTYKDFNGTANPADIPIDNNGRAVVIVNEDMVYRLEVYGRDGALLWSQYPLSPMGGGGGSSGLSEVSHDSTMSGNGTPESPLSVNFPSSNGVKFKGRFFDSVGIFDFDTLPTITIDNSWDRNYIFQLMAPSLYQRISECNECFVLFYFGAHLWTETPPTIDLNSCDLGSVRCEIKPNGQWSQFGPEIIKQVALPQIQGISAGDYQNFCDLSVDAVLYKKNNNISDIRLAFRSVPENIVGAKMEWMYEALVFEC